MANPSRDERIAAALGHHRAGRLVEAEAGYRALLEEVPEEPGVLHNLGVIAAEAGRRTEAIELFDRAIAAAPVYPSAHFNRAGALRAEGRSQDAADAYRRVVALEPDNYEAHRALGFLWQALGRRDRALDHFARTLDLRRGEDRSGIAVRSLTHTTRAKLRHDAEQFRYLAGVAPDRNRQGFEMRARVYDGVAAEIPATAGDHATVPLTDDQFDRLGAGYNTPVHLKDAPERRGGAINPALDASAIATAFTDKSGVTWFEDLLTRDALAALREFLLQSTIWSDFTHIEGFLAVYLEDGLACPLVLQIADEIRAVLPGIFGDHALTQAWAFKGIAGDLPIDMHADDAVVSVNFWVTPGASNLEADHGGLIVCNTPPPPDWRMLDYDKDKVRIREFVAAHEAGSTIIPYRENRAALFDSRLFHGSDAPNFRFGYQHHRINITLLFGVADP